MRVPGAACVLTSWPRGQLTRTTSNVAFLPPQAWAQTRFLLRKSQASHGLQTRAATVSLPGGRTTSAPRGLAAAPPVSTARGHGLSGGAASLRRDAKPRSARGRVDGRRSGRGNWGRLKGRPQEKGGRGREEKGFLRPPGTTRLEGADPHHLRLLASLKVGRSQPVSPKAPLSLCKLQPKTCSGQRPSCRLIHFSSTSNKMSMAPRAPADHPRPVLQG